MQCAYVILSSVAHQDNIFPHYLINGMILEQNMFYIKYDFLSSLQLLRETFLILRKNEQDTINIYIGPHVKWPLFLLGFYEA